MVGNMDRTGQPKALNPTKSTAREPATHHLNTGILGFSILQDQVAQFLHNLFPSFLSDC